MHIKFSFFLKYFLSRFASFFSFSIPAVFCSNNWQSARSTCVNAKTVDLDDITSAPAVVHQLPDFDQDSWSLNSPTKTEKDSSLTALDPTNNNVSTHSRTSRDYSASRLPAASTDAASVRTVGEAVPTNTRPVRETTAAEDALLGSRRQDAASTPVTLQPMSDDRRTLGGPTCIMPNESHRGENHPQL